MIVIRQFPVIDGSWPEQQWFIYQQPVAANRFIASYLHADGSWRPYACLAHSYLTGRDHAYFQSRELAEGVLRKYHVTEIEHS